MHLSPIVMLWAYMTLLKEAGVYDSRFGGYQRTVRLTKHIPGGALELVFGLAPVPPAGGGLFGKAPGMFTGAEGGGALFPMAAGGAAVDAAAVAAAVAAVDAGFPELCKAEYWVAMV